MGLSALYLAQRGQQLEIDGLTVPQDAQNAIQVHLVLAEAACEKDNQSSLTQKPPFTLPRLEQSPDSTVPTLTIPCCPLPMGTNLPWQVRLKQDCVRPLPLRPDTAAQLGEGDPEGGIRVRVSPRSTWGPTWRPTAHLLQRWRWPGPSPCMWWFSLCEPQGYMLVNSVGLLVMSLTALAPSILP